MEENKNMQQPDKEIDLLAIAGRLWRNRRLIVRITAGFFVLGLLIALFSPKAYIASCTVVPQTGQKQRSSGMSSLAALAGINLDQMGMQPQVLSPLVYPNIVGSTAFRKELMYTPLRLQGYDEPVLLIDYLTLKQYRRFSLGSAIRKYTIGLPGLIVKALRGKKPQPAADTTLQEGNIIVLNAQERMALKAMKRLIGINLNDQDGYLTLSAQMPEPVAAAQLCQQAETLLQRYITEFKVEKVQSNLDFIQGRYDEVKREYEEIQMRRADYKDANQHTSTSRARTELEKLDNQYQLAYNLYASMAQQLEQAKINVKETIPILTVINPVTVPTEKAKPRRMVILAGTTLSGAVAGCGLVLLLIYLSSLTGNPRLRRWIKD